MFITLVDCFPYPGEGISLEDFKMGDMDGNYLGYQATVFVFSANHAMIFHHGDLTFICHNELRDMSTSCFHEVCLDMAIKPPLQPRDGKTLVPASANHRDDAQAGICASGFWEDCIFDIRVFHCYARSYHQTQVGSLFHRDELEKKREYGDCVQNIESASFTPIVFTTHGGLGGRSPFSIIHLASLVAV